LVARTANCNLKAQSKGFNREGADLCATVRRVIYAQMVLPRAILQSTHYLPFRKINSAKFISNVKKVKPCMGLVSKLLRQIDNPALDQSQRALLRCRLAKEFEEDGDYAVARDAMGNLWQSVGARPRLDGLDQRAQAGVLLRAGSLTSAIGSANQIEGSQEIARVLLSESRERFEAFGERARAGEALTELAYSYCREGLFDKARMTLRDALLRLSDEDGDLKAVAMLRRAIVEASASRFRDALNILTESAHLFEHSESHALKGRFHIELAVVLRHLAAAASEGREDYEDRALVEYTAAAFHFEQAGHLRYRATVENNLGLLFSETQRYLEAHEHFERARSFFASLKDNVKVAQIDEMRARTLLAEGRLDEAERVARSSAQMLEKAGEQSLLGAALMTQGIALARLGQKSEARATLQRATDVAERAGDTQRAGTAALTLIEELSEVLTPDEMHHTYGRADDLLVNSKRLETLHRLRSCARLMLTKEHSRVAVEEVLTPRFIYAARQTATLLRDAHRIATADGAVLITGEIGTGKELLARMIHEWSGRAGKFVKINCDAHHEGQLLGYLEDGFANAAQNRPLLVRQADGGTLFLDEVAELSLNELGTLLRLIEHGESSSPGKAEPERVDVRVVAATRRNLKEEVAEGRFREDLFYKLQTFHLEIPPLRERPQDIAPLAEHFIKTVLDSSARQVRFTPEAVEAMCRLPLKGNAHELRMLIERTVLSANEGALITPQMIDVMAEHRTQSVTTAQAWEGCSLEEEVLRYEAGLIKRALETTGGSVTQAARLLGITHQGLAFILQGRHKDLLAVRTPVKPRRRSILKSSARRRLK
jgi:DNA-binding NtrC family response regulator/tetratricopeptide (TPR) repeat protein